MRLLITFIATALFFALAACVEEEPQCDFEQEVNCSCDDGSTGELVCNEDGTANCICDDDSQ